MKICPKGKERKYFKNSLEYVKLNHTSWSRLSQKKLERWKKMFLEFSINTILQCIKVQGIIVMNVQFLRSLYTDDFSLALPLNQMETS
jgi:hypothetical protein